MILKRRRTVTAAAYEQREMTVKRFVLPARCGRVTLQD